VESIITVLSRIEINVDSARTNKKICINGMSVITESIVKKLYCIIVLIMTAYIQCEFKKEL